MEEENLVVCLEEWEDQRREHLHDADVPSPNETWHHNPQREEQRECRWQGEQDFPTKRKIRGEGDGVRKR